MKQIRRSLRDEQLSSLYDQPHFPADCDDPETEALLRDIERSLPKHQKRAIKDIDKTPKRKPSQRIQPTQFIPNPLWPQ